MIWINHEKFLGLLNKAAPLYIFKKHSWQNWDEFEELFGIPIRTAKYAGTDKRVQAEIDSWLKDLGSAAWARFPEGVELDIKESNSRDSFNVFNEKRKACNEELATLIDGHFETAKDTGSRAKAGSIIESTQDLITLDDETRVEFLINDELLPFLRNLGYPFAEDDVFIWNENHESTPKERLEIFKGVRELGYRVKREQVETELDVELEEGYIEPPTPPNEPQNVNFKKPHRHNASGAHLVNYREFVPLVAYTLNQDEEDLLKAIFDDPDGVKWDYKSFKASHRQLLEGLKQGYGAVSFDFDSPDAATMHKFYNNLHRFAVDKSTKEVFELNKILKSEAVKNFQEFRNKAKELFPNYRDTWLKTEWDQAWSTSQMGARYNEMMADIEDAPYWRLSAVLDDGTTLICRSLDGKVFRKDDAQTWRFLPPNHWKCRSDAEDVLEGYDGELSDLSDAIAADPDGWDNMQKSGHDVNWGDTGQVFSAAQSYLRRLDDPAPLDINILGFKDFGLQSSEKVKKAALPKWKRAETFQDRTGGLRMQTVQDLPVWADAKELKLQADEIAGLNQALSDPDELYWIDGNLPTLSFFKHYEGVSLKVTTQSVKVTRVEWLTQPDVERRGLLIHTPQEHVNFRNGIYRSKHIGLMYDTDNFSLDCEILFRLG